MSMWLVNAGHGQFPVTHSELDIVLLFEPADMERVRAMPVDSELVDAGGWVWHRVA